MSDAGLDITVVRAWAYTRIAPRLERPKDAVFRACFDAHQIQDVDHD